MAGGVGPLHQQHQAVAKRLGIGDAHVGGHGGQACAQLALVRLGHRAGGVARLGILDHRVGDAAAAIAGLGGPVRKSGHPGADLGARIAGMGRNRYLEALKEIEAVLAEVGRGQIVLGGEGAIEAWLGDPRLGHDGVNTDSADAVAVEQVPRGLADTVGGAARRRNIDGHVDFVGLLTM